MICLSFYVLYLIFRLLFWFVLLPFRILGDFFKLFRVDKILKAIVWGMAVLLIIWLF